MKKTLISADPPDHTRYRSLVNKAFSAKRVATMEGNVRSIAEDLANKFIQRGRVEFVSEFAVPMPLIVIADALGVPRRDRQEFKRWSDDAVAPQSGFLTRERAIECARSELELQKYFAELAAARKTEPQDDLLSDLVNLQDDNVPELDLAELVSIVRQLLVAGNETTRNLLSSTMLLLAQHPEQLRAVQHDLSLVNNLIEEALRVESPVQGLYRRARVDCELAGVKVPAESLLVVMYASANRDEAEFPIAEDFDVCRPNAKSHLAFGLGAHFCVGAALARMEGIVSMRTLLPRMRNLVLDPNAQPPSHAPSFVLRGLDQLHLLFGLGD